MQSVFVRNNVNVFGKGSETIILAHGFGTDQTAWRHQLAVLTERYRVVVFDHVGASQASVAAYSPNRYRSLHSYAADLLEVMASLEIERASYVGHSMSAMIGMLAALEAPECFSRMVFISGSPRYLNDDGYNGGFSQEDLDALYAAMSSNYQNWVSGFAGAAMDYPERRELAAEFARSLANIRPDIAVSVARVIFQSDHRAQLGRLKTPTLVIQTQRDIAVPVCVGEYIARQLPRGELALISAYGHLPHISAPDAVNAALLSYLE